MDEKIKNLWNNNKLAFFLLIMPIVLWVLRDQIIKLLAGSIAKDYQEGLAQDKPLAEEVKKILDSAKDAAADANAHENNANNAVSDADWHKKGDK